MSQTLRSCSKTTNFETINCDSYLSCLSKTGPHKQRCLQRCSCPRQRSLSNSSSKPYLTTSSNMKLRPGTIKQSNLPSAKTQSSSNVLHKEIIHDNSALVEVTVKTQTNRKIRKSAANVKSAGDTKSKQRQPWSDLLKSSESNEVVSTFGSFDPLRTLHFLGRELKSTLKSSTASEATLLKIVTEMMDALNRLPPDVSFSVQDCQNKIKPPSAEIKKAAIGLLNKMDIPEKLKVVCTPRYEHKVCQTMMDNMLFVKTETVQKHLEESIKELDQKCKEMEDFCKGLKMEKHQLERQLITEKDMVRYLRNQMENLQTDQATSKNSTISQLSKENNLLNAQLKTLQCQLDLQVASIDELKGQFKDIQKQKQCLEQDNISLHHNLTIAELEKQKHLAIIEVRDRQMKEILSEMNQLQEVVNDELLEFRKNPPLSQWSSQKSTILENWQQIQADANFQHRNEMGDNAKVSPPINGPLVNKLLFSNCSSSLFDVPSYDSSITDSKSMNEHDYEASSKLNGLFQH